MKGKLIVVEGLDGSGKSTQIERLKSRLNKYSVKQIKLPDYDNPSSTLVKMYLGGEFGTKPEDVNAYAASAFYAVDRFANYKNKWKQYYDEGYIIISDRYTTSNAYHQATKLAEDDWPGFFSWLEDFEYNLISIPKPDVVIYLDMPVEISQGMMSSRYKGDESKKDIHESNLQYLESCRVAALSAAKAMDWRIIKCSEAGKPRSIEDINNEIYDIILKEII